MCRVEGGTVLKMSFRNVTGRISRQSGKGGGFIFIITSVSEYGKLD